MLTVFMLGVLMGCAVFTAYGIYQVNKLKKQKESITDQLQKRITDMKTKEAFIKERLSKAAELAQKQQELHSQAEQPSKNATHSRYKNGLIAEITSLEKQKIDVLQSILTEGFNPIITLTHDNGAREDIPLSEYLAAAQLNMNNLTSSKNDEPVPQPPPTSAGTEPPKQIGKFFVYKGGKPDGTTH